MTTGPGGGHPARIDRYEILRELGRGSMGIVYLAHDPNTDRWVALKLIVPPNAATEKEREESRARFLLEARATGRLQHPGIVTLYDADSDAETGAPFLVMEWVNGRSLAALLRERGALPWREAVRITATIARALEHAHERGIVHRDVKPANVLLANDGAIKMSDFSIAKIATESHTLTGQVLGTPNYMAPEQVRGGTIDGRSDLFGLGAMLYEMLAGEPPFKSDSIASISYKLVHVDPERLAPASGEIPPALEAVVRRALEKDPARRFQSGGELAAALETAARLAGQAEPEAPLPFGESGPLTASEAAATAPTMATGEERQARWRLLRVAAAIALLAAVVGVGYWLGRPASSPPPATATTAPAPAVEPPVPVAQEPARTNAAPPLPAAAAQASAKPELVATSPAPKPAPIPRPPVPAETAPAPAAETAAAAPRESAQPATLSLLYFNRLRHGAIAVWVDGERVWTRQLESPLDLIERVEGDPIRTELSFPPGTHTIEVHISQISTRVESRGAIRASFEAGRTRRLRVTLVPLVPRLGLDLEP